MDPQQQPPQPQPQGDGNEPRRTFNIAVEGCCHGELDAIYATLRHLEQRQGVKVDLLICCGDFQAVRNVDDLETMSVPPKFRALMTFWRYYSGEAVAPVPTLFIGGNHEASNYLWELALGGWAAPNIYFLGLSGAVRFGGHLIAGLSGTYVPHHYEWGHHERLPYDERSVKSAYHVRRLQVHRLMQLTRARPTLFLSHDWPNRVTRHGDAERLFQKKPYFKAEALRGDLGSPPGQELLEALKPEYWFAAHLHCKFAAVVPHDGGGGNGSGGRAAVEWTGLPGVAQQQQPQQQQAPGGRGGGEGGEGQQEPMQQQQEPMQQEPQQQQQQQQQDQPATVVTRFLALDKCLPGRDFLQVLTLETKGPLRLEYDEEWLAILRATHPLLSTLKHPPPLPPDWGGRAGPPEADVAFMRAALAARGGAAIPANFAPTAPPHDARAAPRRGRMPQADLRNPQTEALLQLLGLPYTLDGSGEQAGYQPPPTVRAANAGPAFRAPTHVALHPEQQRRQQRRQQNPEEINIDDSDDDGGGGGGGGGGGSGGAGVAGGSSGGVVAAAATAAAADAHEIALDDDDDSDGGGAGGSGLADGAPDSGDEAGLQQQQPLGGGGGDAAMFGAVDTSAFPYYNAPPGAAE